MPDPFDHLDAMLGELAETGAVPPLGDLGRRYSYCGAPGVNFYWDIEAALKLVAGRTPNHKLSLDEYHARYFATGRVIIDPLYTRAITKTRAAVPVIAIIVPAGIGITIGVGEICTIDGNHRLFRAHADGLKSFPCHLLTLEEETTLRRSGPSQILGGAP